MELMSSYSKDLSIRREVFSIEDGLNALKQDLEVTASSWSWLACVYPGTAASFYTRL